MKRFIMLLLVLIWLMLSACSGQTKPVQTRNNATLSVTDGYTVENFTSQQVTRTTTVSFATTHEVEEIEEDIPASLHGIPSEYRLKQNVDISWDDPLPLPEGEEFQEIFELLGMDGTKPQIPEVSHLFTTEEIEKYFGFKIAKVEEDSQYEAAYKKITYFFEKDAAGNSPSISIKVSTLGINEDPNTYLYLVTIAEPLTETLGVNATITDAMGVLITIHTEKDEIITIQGVSMKEQKELLIDFAKLVYQRLSE